MHAAAWIRLLRRIPPGQAENLTVVTSAGAELSLQSIVRLDEDFLVVRARLAGTSDAGRAFFIPYDQIDLLGFQKPVREEDVRVLFDGPGAWPAAEQHYAASPPPAERERAIAPAAAATPEPQSAPPQNVLPSPAAPGDARALPTKSKVLANLRARLKAGSGSSAR